MSKSLKHIGVVAAVTMLSRVLGLGRDMLVTAVFGMSALASAFYTAFTLPNLFRRLLGEGALTAALVPTLNEELRHRGRAGGFVLLNQVASWLLLVTGLLTAGAMLGLSRFGAAADGEAVRGVASLDRWRMAADLAVLLFPYLVCVCLAAAFSAVLQSLQRFLEPALAGVWLNLVMIGLLAGAVFGGWSATADILSKKKTVRPTNLQKILRFSTDTAENSGGKIAAEAIVTGTNPIIWWVAQQIQNLLGIGNGEGELLVIRQVALRDQFFGHK